MSRLPGALLTLVLVLAGSVSLPLGHGSAQERDSPTGTPTAADTRSVGRELLLQAPASYLPAAPALVRLSRITFEPGSASVPVVLTGPEFLLVEVGQVTADVAGPAVLPAAGRAEARGADPAPTVVVLAQGDRLALPSDIARSFRNEGTEPAALLIADFVPTTKGKPGTAATLEAARTEEKMTHWVLGETVVTAFPEGIVAIHLERLFLRSDDAVPALGGPVLVAVEDGAVAQQITPETMSAVDSTFRMTTGQPVAFSQGLAEAATWSSEERMVLRLGLITPGDPDATIAVSTAAPVVGSTDPGMLAVGTRVMITVPEARLRGAPSLDSPVLAGLSQGRVLIVTGPPVAGGAHVWYPVRDRKDSRLAGYVAADLIAPKGT